MPSEEYGVNQSVDLLVSLGKKPQTLLLPNLVNSSLDEAKARLKAWGLNFGRIYSRKDPNRPRFQVISTSPSPYSKVKKGEVVSLLVSAGEDEGTATLKDLKKFSIHDRSLTKRIVENKSVEDVQAPPRILIAQDETSPQIQVPGINNQASETVEPKKEISFVMPDGFMPKEVKFIHITNEGRTQVYSGTHKPLDLVKVKVPKVSGTKVQIYINDVPIEERRID
jgi:beta-lactam-binding protein with PASTA domain